MSGKKTYLHASPRGHQDLEVSLVGPLPRAMNWLIIERALGRCPSDLERSRIVEVVELHAAVIRNGREARVSAQDIKKSLYGLATMPRANVRRQLARADGWTQAQVETGLMRYGTGADQATPLQIKAAAAARVHKVKRPPGRPSDNSLFARAIIALWRELGGRSLSATARESRHADQVFYGTPIVEFGAALFAAAGVAGEKPAVAERLRKALELS